MNTLIQYRQQIDALDNAILELLSQRFVIVKKIGIYKKKKNLTPLDKKRWQEVLKDRFGKGKRLGLNKDFVRNIYVLIHEHALQLET